MNMSFHFGNEMLHLQGHILSYMLSFVRVAIHFSFSTAMHGWVNVFIPSSAFDGVTV